MAFRAICFAFLFSSLSASGCGTVSNLSCTPPEEGGKSPFGGVKQDVSCIKQASNGEYGLRTHPKSESEQYPQVAIMLFCAADLPFSLLADIAMWPYTVSYTCVNEPVPPPPVTIATTDSRPQNSPPPMPQPLKLPSPAPVVPPAVVVPPAAVIPPVVVVPPAVVVPPELPKLP